VKVIVPVAGYGSRLRPHTFSTAKALLHVAGQPILAHVLAPIIPLKPEEVIFVIGFRGEEIQEYVEHNYSFPSKFVRQDKLLGLGYAVYLGLRAIQDGEVLVLLGDTIIETDLSDFIQMKASVLGVRQVSDPNRFGIVEIRNGQIIGLEEKPLKPKTNLAIVGLYYFNNSQSLRKVLNEHVESGMKTRGEIQFTDALQKMIELGETFVPYEIDSWYDCGKKETMLDTNRHLLEKMNMDGQIPGTTIIPPVYISPGAVIKHCVLGPNVAISEGASVKYSVIRNSIIGPDAQIENVVLEDSLIGRNATVHSSSKKLNVGDSSEIIIT
jgi:glucose-1-phosphate thymidylyltransferase